MMAKSIDWKHIKSEYEETFKSVRQIAKENNISHSSIQKRIKAESWQKLDKDLIKDDYLLNEVSFIDKITIRKIKEIKTELQDNYSPLDEALIVAYAVNYSRWIKMQEDIEKEGYQLTSDKGGKYLSPAFNASKSAEKTLLSIANQLGLSIASRQRLNITKGQKTGLSIFNIANSINDMDIDI
jgi:P27 family predicted phage terminase small subunit